MKIIAVSSYIGAPRQYFRAFKRKRVRGKSGWTAIPTTVVVTYAKERATWFTDEGAKEIALELRKKGFHILAVDPT